MLASSVVLALRLTLPNTLIALEILPAPVVCATVPVAASAMPSPLLVPVLVPSAVVAMVTTPLTAVAVSAPLPLICSRLLIAAPADSAPAPTEPPDTAPAMASAPAPALVPVLMV